MGEDENIARRWTKHFEELLNRWRMENEMIYPKLKCQDAESLIGKPTLEDVEDNIIE